MKLFELCKDNGNMKMKAETVAYLLNEKIGGSTMRRTRYLIANLYNNNAYPNVELFSLIRNADREHQELIMDIIGISQHQFGEACFLMINELAPQIIEKFNLKEDE